MRYGWCPHCLMGAHLVSTDSRDGERVVKVVSVEFDPIRLCVENVKTGRRGKLSMASARRTYRVLGNTPSDRALTRRQGPS